MPIQFLRLLPYVPFYMTFPFWLAQKKAGGKLVLPLA